MSEKTYIIDDTEYIQVEIAQTYNGKTERMFILVKSKDRFDLDMMLSKYARTEAEKMVEQKLNEKLLEISRNFLGIKSI